LRDSLRHAEAVDSESGRRHKIGGLVTMLEPQAGRLPKSSVVLSLRLHGSKSPVEGPLLAVFHVGDGFRSPAVGGGSLRQRPGAGIHDVSRKRIAILYLRCAVRRWRA